MITSKNILGGLPLEHLNRLSSQLSQVFRLTVTEQTFRQIIDKEPIKSSFVPGTKYVGGYPDQPSDQSVVFYRDLRDQLDISRLEIKTDILRRYINDASDPLLEFEVLVEIVHTIAANAFKLDMRVIDGVTQIPLLSHLNYFELTGYDASDARGFEKGIVGFWAETQISGGVAHFDRGSSENEVIFVSEKENKVLNVYIHPNDKKRKLYRVEANAIVRLMANLLNDQFGSATALLSPSEDTMSLPEAQERGIYRIKDFANSYIYRPPLPFLANSGFPRCVGDANEEFKDASWSPELANAKPLILTAEERRQLDVAWNNRWKTTS
ncbi:hypothetical protein TWF694_002939 [Orbilia ellipsospora]|uniref:F-box domain-containing protein n=1 Tax=Orbilia ellipsospora TaxID=2528407 RepID=A0AAV9X1I4_9PEZI